jgi:hypothetical protein
MIWGKSLSPRERDLQITYLLKSRELQFSNDDHRRIVLAIQVEGP